MDRVFFEGFAGTKLAADCFGSPDDPPVLLLPSIGQAKEYCHAAAEALGVAGRYAICIDLRGHGDSGHSSDGRYDLELIAADLKAVLAQLNARASVVAIGASGLAALLAIGEGQLELVSALILVGARTRIDEEEASRVAKAIALRTETFASAEAAMAVLSAVYPLEPAPAATERVLRAFERDAEGHYRWRGDPRALAGISGPVYTDRLEAAAARIRIPTAIVRGTLNSSVSGESARELQSLIAGSELLEIGGGHYVVTDQADAFNAAVLAFLERNAPRSPVSVYGGSDRKALRDALGCFGTGVTIVTTLDADGNPIGLTANSFTSVSLDPPLILFCLSSNSANLETFRNAGRFAINVLHIGQQPTSDRFAGRAASRFDGTDWEVRHGEGAPILPGSLASFDCRTYSTVEAGDHWVFIGQVEQAFYEPYRDPLLYFRGKYRRLHFA